MLRCWVTDFEVQLIRADLGRELWDDVPLWPPSSLARDGVIANVNSDGTEATLTSATGNFKHVQGGQKSVPVGTIVNIAGVGFYRVKSVDSNIQLTIEGDANIPSMAGALAEAAAKRFIVGGHSTKIQEAYEIAWNMPEMIEYHVLATNPLTIGLDAKHLVDKSLYVPDSWHGADRLIKLGALCEILADAIRNNESSYKDIYDMFLDKYEAERETIVFPFDYDSDGNIDTEERPQQIRMLR